MELLDAIRMRRSVRKYLPKKVDKALVEQLLDAAVKAPNAMNLQPWVFGIIQDAEVLRGYSDKAKAHLLANMDQFPGLAGYTDTLSNPEFNIFYGAPTLVMICAKPTAVMTAQGDCCLAAENLMLAARGMGLGSCWIGFSAMYFNLPEIKAQFGIPDDYTVVAPIIVGYPAEETPEVPRNAPELLFWL